MAIGPIDYLGAMPQQDFLKDIQGGLQLGSGIAQINAQQQKQKLAQQRAEQYQTDVAAALKSPTPQAFASLSLNYPDQREAVKQAWDGIDEATRRSEGNAMAQAYSALLAGDSAAALGVVDQQIESRKNSGMDVSNFENARRMIEKNPTEASGQLGLILSHITDPKTFASQFGALGKEQREQKLQPTAMRKAAAEAGTAESEQAIKEVDAKYADSVALQEIAKRGWDIKKIVADIDIGKENNRIAALNAATAREGNSLRRQELQAKLDEAKEMRETKIRERVVDAENAASSMDNMVNTVDRVLSMAVDKASGKPTSLVQAATGPIDSRTPTIQRDVADLESLVETVGAQAFLAQIPNIKGLGALSNAEGEKLQAALQNLSLRQSPEQLISNLNEAKRLVSKGRKNLETRTGVKLSPPDTPNAEPTDGIPTGWKVKVK